MINFCQPNLDSHLRSQAASTVWDQRLSFAQKIVRERQDAKWTTPETKKCEIQKLVQALCEEHLAKTLPDWRTYALEKSIKHISWELNFHWEWLNESINRADRETIFLLRKDYIYCGIYSYINFIRDNVLSRLVCWLGNKGDDNTIITIVQISVVILFNTPITFIKFAGFTYRSFLFLRKSVEKLTDLDWWQYFRGAVQRYELWQRTWVDEAIIQANTVRDINNLLPLIYITAEWEKGVELSPAESDRLWAALVSLTAFQKKDLFASLSAAKLTFKNVMRAFLKAVEYFKEGKLDLSDEEECQLFFSAFQGNNSEDDFLSLIKSPTLDGKKLRACFLKFFFKDLLAHESDLRGSHEIGNKIIKELLPIWSAETIVKYIRQTTSLEKNWELFKDVTFKAIGTTGPFGEVLKEGVFHFIEVAEEDTEQAQGTSEEKSFSSNAIKLGQQFLDAVSLFTISVAATDLELQKTLLRYLPVMAERHLRVLLPHVAKERLAKVLHDLESKGYDLTLILECASDEQALAFATLAKSR